MPVVGRGHDHGVHGLVVEHPAQVPINRDPLPLVLQLAGLTRQDTLVHVAQGDDARARDGSQRIDELVPSAAHASDRVS